MALELLTTDASGFYDLVFRFPDQVAEAVSIASQAALPNWSAKPDNAFLCGMGGSAAGGDFVKALFDTQAKVPFGVSRDYGIPSWVGPTSLGFITSYSGNTEETLEAYDHAKKRGANLICVTSGGELLKRANADGFPVVVVPSGQAPRTALGYMLCPLIVAASKLGLVNSADWAEVDQVLVQVRDECQVMVPEGDNYSKQIARKMFEKVPVVYGQGPLTGAVANRWRGQINENAKSMCLTHVFPELCHNEILGWESSSRQGRWTTVLLQGGEESPRMKARVKETLELIKVDCSEVSAKGQSAVARMLSLAYFGDYVSIYLAELMGEDPAQMKAIDELKHRLSAIPS